MKRPVRKTPYCKTGRFGPVKHHLLFIGFLVLSSALRAQISYTWNGSTSTSWNTATNWTPNGIPGAADNVTIVTGSNTCTMTGATTISTLKVTSGTLDMGGSTLTVSGGTATLNTGTLQNGTFVATGVTSTTFNGPSMTMNCYVNVNTSSLYIKSTTFQKPASFTKTGTSNDYSNGNNTFNDSLTINSSGSGFIVMGNSNPDVYNGAAAFNNTSTGANNLYIAYNSTGNIFNGVTTFTNTTAGGNNIQISPGGSSQFNNNVLVNCTSTGGVYFGNGSGSTGLTLASGYTISVGAAGFTTGTFYLRNFTQLGTTPQNFTLTGSGNMTFNVNNTFNGDVTCTTPTIFLNGTTFNGATNFTKTGTTGDWSTGGNTFNGICNITNNGSSYILMGNNNPDIWNNDVTFTDNGSERILPAWGSTGNQFNGNIYVNTSGSAVGVQFCGGNTTATATLAANKTIQAGSGGLTAGYLYLKQFTQLGNTPVNLVGTGSSVFYLGPNSVFNATVTATAPDIWAQGATYNSPVTFNKTGGSNNHNNQYQNIFNATCTINQQSSGGYFMLGYNSNDLFNDNITVSCTGTGGIYLGWNNPATTGTPTLAAGKTILTGAAGYSAGFLYLNGFTQLGNAPLNFSFTGTTTYLAFARGCSIGGDLTSNTPSIYFNGSVFNGQVNATKTGANNDYNSGGNTFQGLTTLTANGTGYWVLGNGYADTCNADITFNSTGSNAIYPAWNSVGNLYNGNITVTSTNTSTGIYFCWNSTPTAIQAAGKSIQIGSGGFSNGTLGLRQFTQLGNAANNLTLTGATTLMQFGPASSFGGGTGARFVVHAYFSLTDLRNPV